ncbi:MAG: sigma-70 family RNA polymerase sigma factor [Alphaproteobacteria bacterium]|nr:sigma-70 family RNA polymerase sigma factor [Alphaproteobacteria bacterium]
MAIAPAVPDVDHAASILAIAARRDRTAFSGLFTYFAPRVKTYLLRLGASPALAEELAQETMLTVWRKAGLYDPARAGASTWIFTIARNLRLDAARSDKRRQALGDALEAPDPEPGPDAIVAADQREVRLRAAIVDLPPEQAEVIRHAFFHDKAHAEISAELGIPLGTVKSRLRLAINRLRQAMGDLTLGDLK